MSLAFYIVQKAENQEYRQSGCIHDVDLQDRMIPFLKSTSCQIDPYDGGIIPHDEIGEFITNIERALEQLSSEDENWRFSSSQLESYNKRAAAYGFDVLPPLDQARSDLERILDLAEWARRNNSSLIFKGD